MVDVKVRPREKLEPSPVGGEPIGGPDLRGARDQMAGGQGVDPQLEPLPPIDWVFVEVPIGI